MLEALLQRETAGWTALSTSHEAARAFFGEALRDDAVMLFPGGLRVAGKAAILDSFDPQPWRGFELEAAAIVELGADAAALAYRVSADHGGEAPYRALISSVYVRDGGSWLLALHQQTPE
jgi:hypothetical protein